MNPILAGLLSEDGHEVAACQWCSRAFATDLTHDGRRHARQRRYCSRRCRAVAASWRRLPRRRHARRWAALTALHAQEAAGQTSLDPRPLPDVPELEYTP